MRLKLWNPVMKKQSQTLNNPEKLHGASLHGPMTGGPFLCHFTWGSRSHRVQGKGVVDVWLFAKVPIFH